MKSDDPTDFIECLNWDMAITQSGGYENGDLVSYYAERFSLDKPWLLRNRYSTPEDKPLSERQKNLFFGFALALVKLRKQKLRVLDIGGGNGYMAYWLRDFFPEQSFDWTILESPSISENYNKWKEEANINWIHENTFEDSFDVILISCSLQYVQNWSQLIETSIDNCEILFLMRLPILNLNQHKFAVQRIFRKSVGKEFDASVPCHFFAANEIDSLVSKTMNPIYKLIYDHESVIFADEEVKFQDLFFQK
jgi:putative methyltransferase (TIGR04325 family)